MGFWEGFSAYFGWFFAKLVLVLIVLGLLTVCALILHFADRPSKRK